MLINPTCDHLKVLRLEAMLSAWELQKEDPKILKLSFDERLSLIVEAQYVDQKQRRQNRMLKMAKLKINNACIEDIDYHKARGLDKSYVQMLSTCEWVIKNQYIAITGSTGNGKTWLACAFAQQAIRKGYTTLFYRFPRLLEDLEIARLDGSLPKLRTRLSKFKLLVIDDWALSPLSHYNQQDLLEIIDDRTGFSSLIITSQLPIHKWHEYITEPTYADAIMDRILHRTHKFELQGESMRKVYNLDEEN
jgi:DNA replication protein DnaC